MDPFTAVLLASSATSLSQLFKNQLKEQTNNVIGKKLMDKIQKKKLGQIKVDEFKEILREIMNELDSSQNEVDLHLDKLVSGIQEDLQTHSKSIAELQSFVDKQFNEMMGLMDEAVALQFLEIKNELSRTLTVEQDQKTSLMRSVKGMGAEAVLKYSSFKDALVQLTDEFSEENIKRQLLKYGAVIDRNRAIKEVGRKNYKKKFGKLTQHPIQLDPNDPEAIRKIQNLNLEEKFKDELPKNEYQSYHSRLLNLKFLELYLELPMGGKFGYNKNRDPNDRREMFYTDVNFQKFISYLDDPGLGVIIPNFHFIKDQNFRTLIKSHFKDFMKLLMELQYKPHREEFVNFILQIFFKLTEKPAGSLVSLKDILNDQMEFKYIRIPLNDYEVIILLWFLFLSYHKVELPTPFHFGIKAFEVKQDLMQKLTQV